MVPPQTISTSPQLIAPRRVAEQAADAPPEVGLVPHLDRGSRVQKKIALLPEVFEVRTEDDRLRQARRLEKIMAAVWHQRAPDEDDRGKIVESFELSERVDDHDRLAGTPAVHEVRLALEPAPADELRAGPPAGELRGVDPLDVPGRQHQSHFRELPLPVFVPATKNGLFTRMGRSRHDDQLVRTVELVPNDLTARHTRCPVLVVLQIPQHR